MIGGIGLGIGYISPVSTLVKWFPDRPGLATGTAIMGFGGGALIGAPLAVALMKFYSSPTSTGVAPTMLTMGVIYLCFMMIGAFIVRIPAAGWKPEGYVMPDGVRRVGYGRERAGEPSRSHAAVLPFVGDAVSQRHRRHRRARASLADDPGNVPGEVPARLP